MKKSFIAVGMGLFAVAGMVALTPSVFADHDNNQYKCNGDAQYTIAITASLISGSMFSLGGTAGAHHYNGQSTISMSA